MPQPPAHRLAFPALRRFVASVLAGEVDGTPRTQEALAAVLGTSQPSISRLASDAHTPDLEVVVALADAFGQSLDVLLAPTLEAAEERRRERAAIDDRVRQGVVDALRELAANVEAGR
jgi:transcriptional regulator with XRE-family HTH domain